MRLGLPSFRAGTAVISFLVLCVVVLALPAYISDFRAQQLAYVAIYLIALIGLNLLTGYAGQASLGHGAFMAVGGYTTAILVSDQGLKLGGHVFANDMKDVWTIPIAGVVVGIAGLLFGLPAVRLTGLYLALATFAVAVAMPAVIKRFDTFTGGSGGVNMLGLPGETGGTGLTIFGHHLTFNAWLYYLSWSIALTSLAVGWLLLRARTGRAFRAVRDNETAASSAGINLSLYKTLAFGISAGFAGVAGSLYAIANTFVNPLTFPVTLSIFLLVGVVVGGLGSLVGLLLGATFIYFMQVSWAQSVDRIIPDWLPWVGGLNTSSPGAPSVAFGMVLIAIMVLVPSGAAGLLRDGLGLGRRISGRPR